MGFQEADLIKLMCERVGVPSQPEGPGDDASLSERRVTTVDLMVEDVHFKRFHPPFWLGRKLLAVNNSDVGAMGARPSSCVISAALPPDTPVSWWDELSQGLGSLAAETGVSLVGGDLTRSPGPVMLGVTLWGDLDGDEALLRSGGCVGDLVMLHSPQGIGRSSRGLDEWLAMSHQGWGRGTLEGLSACIKAHLCPETSWSEGPWALAAGARAGMDCSDGLLADLPRLAAQSGLRLEIDLALLPEDPDLRGMETIERAAGGEDYGLIVCVPPNKESTFSARGFVTLGHVCPGEGVAWTIDGSPLESPGPSFTHFKGS